MPLAAHRCTEPECCYFGQASASSCACATEALPLVIPGMAEIAALAAWMRQVPRPPRIWPPVATSFVPMTPEEAIEADLFNDVDKAEKAIAAHQRRAEGLQRRWWA